MRRVPQEAFLSTARIFRTIGGPLRYRMPQSQKGERHCLQLVSQIPKRRKHCLQRVSQSQKGERPAASITNAKKEKIACSEGHNCQKRGGQCKKRSPPRQGKQKENDCKNRSLSNLGCDVGLEPTTPRTTIWCSTN